MKKFIIIIAFLLANICKGQSPILSLFYPDYPYTDGAYYKDIDNDFDKFTGTWEYTNGSTSLKIVIQKRTQLFNDFSNIYEDMLVGEYRYVENSVEKVNTLGQINDDEIMHNISGNLLIKNYAPPACLDCLINERRVSLSFDDPTRNGVQGLSGIIVVQRVDSGSVQKIKVSLEQAGNIIYIEGIPPQYTSLNVPWGEYILTKVN